MHHPTERLRPGAAACANDTVRLQLRYSAQGCRLQAVQAVQYKCGHIVPLVRVQPRRLGLRDERLKVAGAEPAGVAITKAGHPSAMAMAAAAARPAKATVLVSSRAHG
jgi:hypothetical protein